MKPARTDRLDDPGSGTAVDAAPATRLVPEATSAAVDRSVA
jgi:hypothetical protein